MIEIKFTGGDFATPLEAAAVVAAMHALYPGQLGAVAAPVESLAVPSLSPAQWSEAYRAGEDNGYTPAETNAAHQADTTPVTIPAPPPSDPVALYEALGGEMPAADDGPADDTAQLDSEGFPYDARIHSTPAKLNASDGKWRAKRGVSNELVASVRSEIGVRSQAAPPVPQPPTAPPVPQPPAAPPADAPAAPPPPPAPPAATETPTTFAQMMRKVSDLQTAGQCDSALVNRALTACGLTSVTQLNSDPSTVPGFNLTLDAFVAEALAGGAA